jgi:energy-coupling factor transporter transmembrane protein EcfT
MQVFRMLMRINPHALLILFLLVISVVVYIATTSPIVIFVFYCSVYVPSVYSSLSISQRTDKVGSC